MIIIYDFDGTLTPYSFPKYQILKECGYDEIKFKIKIAQLKQEKNYNLYEAFYEGLFQILKEQKLFITPDILYKGVENTEWNPGVLKYFKKFSNKKIKHYVVTAGLEDYVKRTPINKYLETVLGTTMKKDYYQIESLVTDKEKPKLIEKILSLEESVDKNIIYIGDGFTDRYAFRYVHELGGKTIYLSNNKETDENYLALKKIGIIDECFSPDYSENTDLYQYIQNLSKKI